MGDITAEIESRIYALGKTLQCPICLCIMEQPARLPCLHYFCWGCITHNVKPRGEVVCPSCRDRSNRRDIQEDSLLATFARRYGQIEAALGKTLHLSQLPPLEPLEPSGPAAAMASAGAGAAVAAGTDMAEGRRGKQRRRGKQQQLKLQEEDGAQAQGQGSGHDEGQQHGKQRKQEATAEHEEQEHKATKAGTSQMPQGGGKRAKAAVGSGRATSRQGAKGRSADVPDKNQAGEPPAQLALQQAPASAAVTAAVTLGATAPATGGRLFGFLDPTGEDRSPEDTHTTALIGEKCGEGGAPDSVHNGRSAAAAGGRRGQGGAMNKLAIDDVWQSLIASQHRAPPAPAAADPAAEGAGVGAGVAAGAKTSAAPQDEAGLARCRAAVALPPGQTPAPAGGLLRVLRGSAAVTSPAAGEPLAVAAATTEAGEAHGEEGLATGAMAGGAVVGSGTATNDGERGSGGDGGGGRRVPSRLQPWACGACTFENLAGAKKCRMCRTPKPPTASKAGPGPAGATSPSQACGGDVPCGAATQPMSGKRPAAATAVAGVSTDAAGSAGATTVAVGGGPLGPEPKRKKTTAMTGSTKAGTAAESVAAARRASATSRAALPSALTEAGSGPPGGQDDVAAGKENEQPVKDPNGAAPAGKTTAGANAGGSNSGGKRRRASAPTASGRTGTAAPASIATETATAAEVALSAGVLTAAAAAAAVTTATAGPDGAVAGGGAGSVHAETAADRRRKSVPAPSNAAGTGAAGGAGCIVTPRPPLPSAAGLAGGRKSGTGAVAGVSTAGGSSRKKARVSPPAAARDVGAASPPGDVAAGAGDGTQQQATQTTHRASGCGSSAAGSRWSVPCPGWVILGSGLEEGPGGKGMVRKLAAAAGAKVVDTVGPTVTHVLCGTDGSRRARRTFKYLMGVANGCWVLDVGWAAACLSAGAPVPEADWQVVGDQGGGACGAPEARRRRLLRHQPQQDEEAMQGAVSDGARPSEPATSTAASCEPLLHNARVYIQVSATARDEVSALVRALGATLLTKLPIAQLTSASPSAPPASAGAPHVAVAEAANATVSDAATAAAMLPDPLILVDPDAAATAARGGGGAAARQFGALSSSAAALGGMPLVSYRWLHDSAGCYSLMPLAGYIVTAQRH